MSIKINKTIYLNSNDKSIKNIVTSLRSASKLYDLLEDDFSADIKETKDSDVFEVYLNSKRSILDIFSGYNKFEGILTIDTSQNIQKISIDLERSLNLSGWCMLLGFWISYGISLIALAFSLGNDTRYAETKIQQALESLDFQYN